MNAPPDLYDTTLRDGAQGAGVSLSVQDKLTITEKLDELGIDYVEGGWPGANPKDAEYFERLEDIDLRHAQIAAFSYTRGPDREAESDPNLLTLVTTNVPVTTVVGKSSADHVARVLGTDLDENLQMIAETVEFLRSSGRRVFYDAEQFFDGFKRDRPYALETLAAAEEAGAEVIILCDTNGGSMPWEVGGIVAEVRDHVGVPIGIHAHNDCELGVANTLAAVRAGAVQVQGTINGWGERVGNANLTSIIPLLKLKLGISCVTDEQLQRLTDVARAINLIGGMPTLDKAPFVGRYAFAHKAGLHADATRKYLHSYQHVDPDAVGNETRFLVSELSGKASVISKLEEHGLSVTKDQARTLAHRIKTLESEGFVFEEADASLQLLALREVAHYVPPGEDLEISIDSLEGATEGPGVRVRIEHQDRTVEPISETGRDPAATVVKALQRCLVKRSEELDELRILGWEISTVGSAPGGAPDRYRVFIRWAGRGDRKDWSTVGCAPTVNEALVGAVKDGLAYALFPSRSAVKTAPKSS